MSVSVVAVAEDETFGKAREKEFVKEKTVSLLFFEKGKKETKKKKKVHVEDLFLGRIR